MARNRSTRWIVTAIVILLGLFGMMAGLSTVLSRDSPKARCSAIVDERIPQIDFADQPESARIEGAIQLWPLGLHCGYPVDGNDLLWTSPGWLSTVLTYGGALLIVGSLTGSRYRRGKNDA